MNASPTFRRNFLRSVSALIVATTIMTPILGSANTSQQGSVTIHSGSDHLDLIGKNGNLEVTESQPVSRWILHKGDLVIRINGTPTGVPEDLFRILRDIPDGGSAGVEVRREGRNMSITLPKNNYAGSLPPAPPTPPPVPR